MIFVANYKMNGDKDFYKKVNKIFNKLKNKDTVVLCPPFVYMPFFKIKNKNIFLGSQDISNDIGSKCTGQIAPKMLKEFGVRYTLIGHGERRKNGETNEQIANKVKIAQQSNIIPIICVGENSKNEGVEAIIEQVNSALQFINGNEIIFAYEPIWAIGTGEVPTVLEINKAVKLIRETLKTKNLKCPVLYGGSVASKNSKQIRKAKIDGFLMGGVSMRIEEFIKIVKGE